MSRLLQIQDDIVMKLNSEAYFASIPVYAIRRLRTVGEANREQPWTIKKDGTHCGIGIHVGMPRLRVADPNVPGPQYDLEIEVRVLEQPLLSENSAYGLNTVGGGNKSAEEAAEEVASTLHQWVWGGCHCLFARADCIRPDIADKNLVQYVVTLIGNKPTVPSVRSSRPSVSIEDNVVTVDAEPGATTYYTTDGTTPVAPSINATSAVYTAPVLLGSGLTFRCAVYEAGKQGSQIIEVQN
jgi:hypothetical protein